MPTLEDKEAHYHLMFSENRAVMLLINPDDGRIVDASQGACQYYGYSLPEITEMNISGINTMTTSAIEAEMQRAKECSKNHFNFHHRLASGEIRDVEVYSNPIAMDGHTFLYSVIHDITERKALETTLERYSKIISATNDHLSYLDTNYTYLAVNDAYLDSHNKERQEIVSHTVSELFGEDVFQRLIKPKLDECIRGEVVNYQEWFEMAVTGRRFMDVTYYPVVESPGEVVGVVVNSHDITERKQTEDRLEHMATHDALTELYTRTALEGQLNDELLRAVRYEHALSLFMLDLDHFKFINDTYGHQVGDSVLQGFADVLKSALRKTDIAARYGGEEFVIILQETPLSEAEDLAERLRKQIDEHSISIADGKEINITASIGIAAFPVHGESLEDLLNAADSAMYAAKYAGRNCVRVAKTEG
jgi:diguanylate cyclase (GGDEF)-like protein/PAS domain S-box-containing protein